jgi:para-aminobenzoate synthetase
VMHGRLSPIQHDESALFAGIPQDFLAVRYHSLVAGTVPAELRVSAWTPDGVVMGLEHRARPLFGVQFHPESVSTRHGRRIIENFRDITRSRRKPSARPARRPRHAEPAARAEPIGARVHHWRLETWCEPEAVFDALYADHDHAVWLDSATEGPGMGRFSFVGAPDGPLGEVVRYDVGARRLAVERASGRELRTESVLDYCRDRLTRLRADAPELPFDFTCGFAGYLGYELKAECGARAAHASPLPDAGLVLCDRLIAFDHAERHVYLLALADAAETEAAQAWLATTAERLRDIARDPPPLPPPPAPPGTLRFEPHDSAEAYLANIAACLDEIVEGETYEVCLTTELRSDGSLEPVPAYRALRARNPAPFAALVRLGDVSVLSSSPERFLRVDRDRVVESRPMKGTAARVAEPFEDACRAAELRRDKKTRAENLMIADLVRNDLGRVSDLGTVEVPGLMIVEPYATVHQMVTVVRGRLREGCDALDCVRAAFPAGSMTGAPKLRTLEIIDRIEDRPRGVYSGALGFFSVNGTADLSVVIRTLVASPDGVTIGAGGAIVAASGPEAELDEMLLKARPLLETVGGTLEAARDLASTHR